MSRRGEPNACQLPSISPVAIHIASCLDMSSSPGAPSPDSKSDKTTAKLPFEPGSTQAKPPKVVTSKATTAKAKTTRQPSGAARRPDAAASTTVPEVVSRRMVRRMSLFSGVPTFLGMLTFVASYFIVTQGGIKLPTSAVLLVSLGFFGLGVLGLSYGILSTSWDEEQAGSWLGTEQFSLNLGRMKGAWREARNQAKP